MVGSSAANLFTSLSAGICALSGPLHGGANVAVDADAPDDPRRGRRRHALHRGREGRLKGNRLMGFGHAVYRNFDPRAKIIGKACDEVLNKLGINDPLLDIAKKLEEAALKDDYFLSRKLYPNVDFYSGIIMRALGIPNSMFTVIFAIGGRPAGSRTGARWPPIRRAGSTGRGRSTSAR
jgi:citrate synthase